MTAAVKERPMRVQLSRRKGSRMPPNTVSVARPGRFGNPYPVDVYGLELSLKLFRDTARGFWNPSNVEHLSDADARATYDRHCRFRERLGCHSLEAARSELRGKNVACWCALDAECHADIWLEIANG